MYKSLCKFRFQVLLLVATCPDATNLCWPKSWACLWTWLRQDKDLWEPRQEVLHQPSWNLGAGGLGLAGRGVWRRSDGSMALSTRAQMSLLWSYRAKVDWKTFERPFTGIEPAVFLMSGVLKNALTWRPRLTICSRRIVCGVGQDAQACAATGWMSMSPALSVGLPV